MPAWNDFAGEESSETWRAPFRKCESAYPFEGAEKLVIPDIPYIGNAHCSDYHGRKNGTSLRVRFWYGSSFDEELQATFHARLMSKLRDWSRACGHKNISHFSGLVESPRGNLPSLVTPLYGTDINQYLRHTQKTNPLLLLLKVSDALAYMHSLNPPVVHGAVRGANIHLDEHGEPKLVDTGLEHLPRAYGASEDQRDHDNLRWMAPEIIDPPYEYDEQDNDIWYDSSTPETDVWSFGMTMLEVLSGKMPWAHFRRTLMVVHRLVQGELPQRPQTEAITDSIWKLILLCLEREPCRRITMKEVRNYLQSYVLCSHVSTLNPKHKL